MDSSNKPNIENELRFANAVIHEAKEQIDLLLRLLDERAEQQEFKDVR